MHELIIIVFLMAGLLPLFAGISISFWIVGKGNRVFWIIPFILVWFGSRILMILILPLFLPYEIASSIFSNKWVYVMAVTAAAFAVRHLRPPVKDMKGGDVLSRNQKSISPVAKRRLTVLTILGVLGIFLYFWLDNTVPFKLTNGNGKILYEGTLDVKSGAARIALDHLQYSGVFLIESLPNSRNWRKASATLRAENGSVLRCLSVSIRDDGFGDGQCTGPNNVTYEVRLKEVSHM